MEFERGLCFLPRFSSTGEKLLVSDTYDRDPGLSSSFDCFIEINFDFQPFHSFSTFSSTFNSFIDVQPLHRRSTPSSTFNSFIDFQPLHQLSILSSTFNPFINPQLPFRLSTPSSTLKFLTEFPNTPPKNPTGQKHNTQSPSPLKSQHGFSPKAYIRMRIFSLTSHWIRTLSTLCSEVCCTKLAN